MVVFLIMRKCRKEENKLLMKRYNPFNHIPFKEYAYSIFIIYKADNNTQNLSIANRLIIHKK